MVFACYVFFAGVLSKLANAVRELDRRVEERTSALEREGKQVNAKTADALIF
jgi:hypothetical protein